MKLYYAPHACSLAPHILLRELGLPFSLEQVDLKTKRTSAGRDFLEVNPKGYVPALELDDGFVLTENPAIAQYLTDQAPRKGLAPQPGSRDQYVHLSWLAFVNSEVHKPFGALFAGPPPDQRQAAVDKIGQRLDWIDAELANREWLVGDAYSAADIYLYVITGWCPSFGIDLRRWPNLLRWRGRIAQRPAVKAAEAAEKAPATV